MKEFWENQAKKFEDDVKAVNFDPLEEDLEIFFLERLLSNSEIIADLGCGNGRTIFNLAPKYPQTKFYGIDFSEGMINIANKKKAELNIPNVNFFQFDASSKDLSMLFDFKFDKIITKRLLINLKGDTKYNALDSIHSMLKKDGLYIMIECFVEPLNKINEIRKQLILEEIQVKFFNEYLSFDILKDISDKFEIIEKKDFGSLYYFISRIFNAYLSNGNPDYLAPINKLAVELSKKGVNPLVGYAPEMIFMLRKK